MRKALVVTIAIFVMAAAAMAQGSPDVLLGPHNTNNTFGCQSCHAPHSQVLAGSGLYLWGLSVPNGTYKTYGGGTVVANLTSGVAPTDTSEHTVLCLSCHDQTFNAIMGGGQPTSPTVNMSTPITNFTGSGDGQFTSIGGGVASGAFDISANHPVHVYYPNINGTPAAGYDAPTAYKYWVLSSGGGSVAFKDTGTIYGYGHTARIYTDSGLAPYIECSSCHNPHSQTSAVVTVNGVKKTVATAHFIRGEYDNTQTQSAFCMSCHADKAAAWNGTGQQ